MIGIAGDHIRIVNQIVYRNKIALNEPYVRHKSGVVDSYRDNFPSKPPPYAYDPARDPPLRSMLEHHVENGELVIPSGQYFVLGDNRDNSLDSRYWGFLDARDIVGEPVFIYDSEEEPLHGTKGAKATLVHRKRWNRLFKFL